MLPAASSCGGEGPRRVQVIGYDERGQLGLVTRELETVDDLTALRGAAARLYGGARLAFDEQQLFDALERAEAQGKPFGSAELARLVVRDEGEPVKAGWIEQDGVAYPEDYDSLAMFTAYYHVELAWLALRRVEPDLIAMDPLQVFFEPVYTSQSSASPLDIPFLDNALYFPPAASMLLLASQDLEAVPLPMNPGAVLHEYGHAVFDRIVYGGRYFTFLLNTTRFEPLNLLRAYDEGTADFFAAALSGDPAFVGRSIPALAGERDVSMVQLFTPEMEDRASQGGYDPYPLGSVWASALWAISLELGRAATLDLVLRCLPQLATRLGSVEVLTLPELLVRAAPYEQATICRVLRQRFAAASWPGNSACFGPVPQGGAQ